MKITNVGLLGVMSAALAFAAADAARAQAIAVPFAPNLHTTDAIPVVPYGAPSAQGAYATPAQIAGVPGYVKSAPVGSFVGTFANTQEYLSLNPASSIASATITTAPNPSDGQRECIFDITTIGALTLVANTSVNTQTINNGLTSLPAATGACWQYSASNFAWDRD